MTRGWSSPGRLAQLTAGQADTLLEMLAEREILGVKPGEGLGVPRAAVDVLISKATSLDLVPLENRIQLVIGKCSVPQAARVYSLIRPLRIGFRRI